MESVRVRNEEHSDEEEAERDFCHHGAAYALPSRASRVLYDIPAVKALLLILIVVGVATLPFAFLKQPWAVKLWQRLKLVVVVYAIVILVSAIVSLVFRWDAIYG